MKLSRKKWRKLRRRFRKRKEIPQLKKFMRSFFIRFLTQDFLKVKILLLNGTKLQ